MACYMLHFPMEFSLLWLQERLRVAELPIDRLEECTGVLGTAAWRGNSVFASPYLRDVRWVYEDCYPLGPIVAGGGVVA